jgi:hypothetical protein
MTDKILIDRKELEQVLEALQESWRTDKGDIAITALREALAEQPAPVAKPHEQVPVEVKQIAEALRQVGLTLVRTGGSFRVMDLGRIEAQTTSPPAQRKPLTFSTLCDIEYEITHRDGDFSILNFARAIEAAHGIKGDA